MKEALWGGILGAVLTALFSFFLFSYQHKIEQKSHIYAKLFNEYGDATLVSRAAEDSNKLHWYKLNAISTHLAVIGDEKGSSAVKKFYEDAKDWGTGVKGASKNKYNDALKKLKESIEL